MYKRITRMLSGLLQEGYEAVPQQETKRSVETEVPPSYVSETEAGPEPVYEFSEATEEDYRYLDLMIGWDSFSQLSAEDAAFLIAYTGITEQEYIQAEANGKGKDGQHVNK